MLRPRHRLLLALALVAVLAATALVLLPFGDPAPDDHDAALSEQLVLRLNGPPDVPDPPAPSGLPAPSAAPVRQPPPAAPDGKAGAEKLPTSPAPADEPYTIQPPYEIVDGITFGPEGALRTRLADAIGPARDAICFDPARNLWACGLQARAALNNLIRQQSFTCRPVGPPTDVVRAQCRAGDLDLRRELIRRGFVRVPRPGGGPEDPDEAEARRQGAGLWNGGWSIR